MLFYFHQQSVRCIRTDPSPLRDTWKKVRITQVMSSRRSKCRTQLEKKSRVSTTFSFNYHSWGKLRWHFIPFRECTLPCLDQFTWNQTETDDYVQCSSKRIEIYVKLIPGRKHLHSRWQHLSALDYSQPIFPFFQNHTSWSERNYCLDGRLWSYSILLLILLYYPCHLTMCSI